AKATDGRPRSQAVAPGLKSSRGEIPGVAGLAELVPDLDRGTRRQPGDGAQQRLELLDERGTRSARSGAAVRHRRAVLVDRDEVSEHDAAADEPGGDRDLQHL